MKRKANSRSLPGILLRAVAGAGFGLLTALVVLSFRMGSLSQGARTVSATMRGNTVSSAAEKVDDLFICPEGETLQASLAAIESGRPALIGVSNTQFLAEVRSKRTSAERAALWRVYLDGFPADRLGGMLQLLKDPMCPRLAADRFTARVLQLFPDSAPAALKEAGADWQLIAGLLGHGGMDVKTWVASARQISGGKLGMADIQEILAGAGTRMAASEVPDLAAYLAPALQDSQEPAAGLAKALSASSLKMILSLWDALPVNPRYERIFENSTASALATGNSSVWAGFAGEPADVIASLRPEVGRRVVEGIAGREAILSEPAAALSRALDYADPRLQGYALRETMNVLLAEKSAATLKEIEASTALRENLIVKEILSRREK